MSTPPKPSSTTSTIEASAHLSQGNRHRQRAISMLSTASNISDVLNQDALLEDDNCSLKSDDLMCDYDETLTMDSTASKTYVIIFLSFLFFFVHFDQISFRLIIFGLVVIEQIHIHRFH